MTAVEFLFKNMTLYVANENEVVFNKLFEIALKMEKQERQKVDKLLDTLLENNMCSHAGDKLIEQFKKDNI